MADRSRSPLNRAIGQYQANQGFSEAELLISLLDDKSNGHSGDQESEQEKPQPRIAVHLNTSPWDNHRQQQQSRAGGYSDQPTVFFSTTRTRETNATRRRHGNHESDDEMIDIATDGNPFADPHKLPALSEGTGGTCAGDVRSTTARSHSTIATPIGQDDLVKSESGMPSRSVHELPRGYGQYDDFETIDWVKDITFDRQRHRTIHREKKKNWLSYLLACWDSGSGWFCVLLIGVLAGLIAGVIDIGSTWMSDLKEGICKQAFWLNKEQCCWSSTDAEDEETGCKQWYTWSRLFMDKNPSGQNPDAYFVCYLCYVLWGLLFAALCVMLVRMFAPYACGSGIPEIKTILSGFIIRGYLGKWTLLIKSVGMMLAVSAGLSLGKEGPMVHMASCCGNILAYFFPKYGKNEAKKREILSASAAAGVAVAFGAPIGGVLFSLEEASYYFPLKTMFRAFFCAMVSANVLRMLNPYGSENLVMFYVEYKTQWHIPELLPFAALGVMGGVFGTIFTRANLYVCRLRKTTRLGTYPIREVLLVTLITVLMSYPHEYLRINSSQLIRLLVSACPPGENITLCNYLVNASDKTLTTLGNYPAGPPLISSMKLLSVALLFKIFLTVVTFGIKVPAGIFIPSMVVGAIMGRLLGVGVEQLVVNHRSNPLIIHMCKSGNPCINPGLYAMVGAAACLGGVTRMTISLVVIMLELTGGLTYIIPLMVAAMVSKWTGDRLAKGSIYDAHIRLNGYPYLSGEDELWSHTSIAADVMMPRRADSSLYVITQDSMTLEDVEDILINSEVNGFPLVVSRESQYLIGWITRRELVWTLDNLRRCLPDIKGNSLLYFTEHSPMLSASDTVGATAGTTAGASRGCPLHLRHIVDLSPVTVTDQTPMETVLDFFRKLGLRQVLVTRSGRLLGIITKKDVLRHLNCSTQS